MNGKPARAYALDQAIDGIGCGGGAAFGFEDVATAGLALQLAEGAQFVAADRMRCWLAVLYASNVQSRSAIEFDL